MQIRKTFRFEAAHVLPFHPGKCARMHGHSYVLEVAVRGPLQESGPARGMILDFDEIKTIVRGSRSNSTAPSRARSRWNWRPTKLPAG